MSYSHYVDLGGGHMASESEGGALLSGSILKHTTIPPTENTQSL